MLVVNKLSFYSDMQFVPSNIIVFWENIVTHQYPRLLSFAVPPNGAATCIFQINDHLLLRQIDNIF